MTWPEKSFFFSPRTIYLDVFATKIQPVVFIGGSKWQRSTDRVVVDCSLSCLFIRIYIETLYRRNSSRLILQIASPRHIDHTHSLRGIYVYICDAMNVEKIFPSDLYRSKIARRSLLCTMINPRLGYDNCPSSFTVTATNRKLGITRNDRRPIYILLHITAHRTMFDNSSR